MHPKDFFEDYLFKQVQKGVFFVIWEVAAKSEKELK